MQYIKHLQKQRRKLCNISNIHKNIEEFYAIYQTPTKTKKKTTYAIQPTKIYNPQTSNTHKNNEEDNAIISNTQKNHKRRLCKYIKHPQKQRRRQCNISNMHNTCRFQF
uniref:Uncharacterized protein n=1 Tax=Cacopsylla melanoneura TaxID=428564 RepID=A0A8D8RDS6_9HEMI